MTVRDIPWDFYRSDLRNSIYLCIASFVVGDRNPSFILTLTQVRNLVAQVDYEYSSFVGDRPKNPHSAF
ncbi:hypothetical protein [Oscillatoria nigro-viridis]|uniref:hypothetical protein n=1 Tax=Phormidium nigroviride TaxID=482564 RepID=UPI0002F84261